MEEAGTGAVAVAANQELLDFMTDHGLNPLSSQSVQEVQQVFSDYKEEIRSLDPFEAQFIFSIRDETLALTVDEDLTVVGTSG